MTIGSLSQAKMMEVGDTTLAASPDSLDLAGKNISSPSIYGPLRWIDPKLSINSTT